MPESHLDLLCDVDAGEWTLQAEADAWTSGGRLYFGTDTLLESHYVRSVSAAADGSHDELSLDLDIVGDWREQEDGSSTAVRCAERVDLVFVIYDRDGDVSDCLARGPTPEQLMAEDDVPDCEAGP